MSGFRILNYESLKLILITQANWDLVYRSFGANVVFFLSDRVFGRCRPGVFERAMRSFKGAYFYDEDTMEFYDRFEIYLGRKTVLGSTKLVLKVCKTNPIKLSFETMPFRSRSLIDIYLRGDFIDSATQKQGLIQSFENKVICNL